MVLCQRAGPAVPKSRQKPGRAAEVYRQERAASTGPDADLKRQGRSTLAPDPTRKSRAAQAGANSKAGRGKDGKRQVQALKAETGDARWVDRKHTCARLD